MRYRLVRIAALAQLRADQAELESVRAQLHDVEQAALAAKVQAKAQAQDLLRQLGQALAGQVKTERERDEQFAGLQAVIRQVTAERDAARTAVRQEYGDVVEEMRADLAQLRADAADTETGESMRAAIAYGVLGRMINEVRARSEEGELRPPFDVVALVLGFTDEGPKEHPDTPPAAVAERQR
ncbi:hypothetical protein [Streptomyces sp. XY533]|uniref:hypothetical protein n=1 Tax=Streptomyces sp. XY533 TaxID=1519481 RepID=UPI0006B06D2F|nr:hypothetical protein [Streptomyces sp. XY533]KOU99109.1 hypothetical protein ADK92_12970 [Streptomyces sp. XY533]